MAVQITKHFSLNEFFDSVIAKSNNINNFPCSRIDASVVYRNVWHVACMLEIIRRQFGRPIRITSGYRCAELNKLVGGAKRSKHLDGLAVDINCGKALNKKLYLTIQSLKFVLPVDELINENNYSWIHVSFKQL